MLVKKHPLGELLLEPGRGWLRFQLVDVESYYWESDACAWAPEWHREAPPIRRLAIWLLSCVRCPLLMLVGIKRDDTHRYRYSWEEARPYWPSDLAPETDRSQ